MIGKYYSGPSTKYLVESFVLSSEDRVVLRKGKERKPDPSFKGNSTQFSQLSSAVRGTGKKVKDIDLRTLTFYFDNYIRAVNIVLSRIYRNSKRVEQLGKTLAKYRGKSYILLSKEKDLCYQHNEDIKKLVFGRLHRNVLEQAGRMLLADWTRRQLVISALKVLNDSPEELVTILRRRRIPSFLIRKVRDSCESTKNNGSGYHYAMGVLRQLRLAIDKYILGFTKNTIGWRARQRKKVASLLKDGSPDCQSVINIVESQVKSWVQNGYPFTVPQLRRYSLDFSASTENSTGQGYWFTPDEERENEILLYLKLPPGFNGTHHKDSPYKSKTLTFRFLDWLPRAASQDRRKAEKAEREGNIHRVEQLRFRAAKFEDMHHQLMNTIKLQHTAHRLSRMKQIKHNDLDEIIRLQQKVSRLKGYRRCSPPQLLLRGHKIILRIPFLSPNGPVSSQIFGERKYTTKAGADRGLRAPVALTVERECSFEDFLITVGPLAEKRDRIRKHAYTLTSELARMKNNWESKRSGQSYPAHIMKRDRHVEALWRKVRRLDREIVRQVASQTVWFCEEHRVKRLFFEDLRSFQGHAGSKHVSYNLTSNLWGKIINTVRYMRESLGHSKYSVWTVNPRYTSQTCHQCGEKGVRVRDESSIIESKGGEYFYCSECKEHFHADINAARNIIHVQDSSDVPGGTKVCPVYNER